MEYVTEALTTGTSIEYLSVYPTKEAEYLYPPLTRIKLEDSVIINQDQLTRIEEELKKTESESGESSRSLYSAALVGTPTKICQTDLCLVVVSG